MLSEIFNKLQTPGQDAMILYTLFNVDREAFSKAQKVLRSLEGSETVLLSSVTRDLNDMDLLTPSGYTGAPIR